MELRKCTASLDASVAGSATADRLAALHAAWLDLVAARVRFGVLVSSVVHALLSGTRHHVQRLDAILRLSRVWMQPTVLLQESRVGTSVLVAVELGSVVASGSGKRLPFGQ
jgi:hypothetical protein